MKWSLKKTLSRGVSFRPIENEDMKYLWAAYKKGKLESMGEPFDKIDMNPNDFDSEFKGLVASGVYSGMWILLSKDEPIGAVLGFWGHPIPRYAPFMTVGDIIWFPQTTARQKIEASVNFFNEARKDIQFVEYASQEHKRFFEIIAKHGVMRRVGTMHNVYSDEPAAVFETRAI